MDSFRTKEIFFFLRIFIHLMVNTTIVHWVLYKTLKMNFGILFRYNVSDKLKRLNLFKLKSNHVPIINLKEFWSIDQYFIKYETKILDLRKAFTIIKIVFKLLNSYKNSSETKFLKIYWLWFYLQMKEFFLVLYF